MNLKSLCTAAATAALLLAPGAQAQNRIELQGNSLFLSGMNLAWIDFANDVGDVPLNENRMRRVIQDVRDAGGNALRWWLFTDAQRTPVFTDGLVSGIGTHTIENVIKALDIAEENGVVISLCLLSFDLMQDHNVAAWNNKSIENNRAMLTTDAGITAFIDNALIPLVQGVGDHPAIMTWEVFNEPEGMTSEFGWTPHRVAMADVQKVVNRVAGAIKDLNLNIPVSTGTHSFHANSDVPSCSNCMNYYRDDRLIAAGGRQNGTLDFYQVHYYPQHFDNDRNPFAHPASYWGLDKPIVIGEFPAGDWVGNARYRHSMTNLAAFNWAYDNGYAGAMSWDFNGFQDEIDTSYTQDFSTTKPSLEALFAAHEADIKIRDVVREVAGGNGVMQVQYSDVEADGASIERIRNFVFTGKTTLSVDVRVVSGAPFSFRAVLKTGDSWDWRQTETFCDVPVGDTWTTCNFDLDGFAAWDNPSLKANLGNVKSIIFQTYTAGYTGTVQFDNVRAQDVAVDNFDEQFDLWSIAGGMTGGSAITEITTVYVGGATAVRSPGIAGASALRYAAGALQFARSLNAAAQVEIRRLDGTRVALLFAPEGSASLALPELQAGVYLVRLQGQGAQIQGSIAIR